MARKVTLVGVEKRNASSFLLQKEKDSLLDAGIAAGTKNLTDSISYDLANTSDYDNC